MSEIRKSPRFPKRLALAAANLLTPLHAALIALYFASRWLGLSDWWLIDALGYILPWLFLPLIVLWPAVLLRRSRLLFAVAGVPTALFLLTYGALYLPRWPVRTAGPTFTVMAYNVLYLNTDVDGVVGQIEAHAPDLVALRELEPPMARALESHFVREYPYRRFEPGCGFFSRYPILEYAAFQLVAGEGDWVQWLVLDIKSRPLNVLSVHPRSPPLRGFHPFGLPLGIPTGFDNARRDADIRALLALPEEMETPLVVLGDFNLVDQHTLYAALTRTLRDAHRESGWGMGFTFTRFPRLGLPTWRIDYVFHSPDLVALSTTVGDWGGSDHRPVIARLAFQTAPEGDSGAPMGIVARE